jgi:hypothetical protein
MGMIRCYPSACVLLRVQRLLPPCRRHRKHRLAFIPTYVGRNQARQTPWIFDSSLSSCGTQCCGSRASLHIPTCTMSWAITPLHRRSDVWIRASSRLSSSIPPRAPSSSTSLSDIQSSTSPSTRFRASRPTANESPVDSLYSRTRQRRAYFSSLSSSPHEDRQPPPTSSYRRDSRRRPEQDEDDPTTTADPSPLRLGTWMLQDRLLPCADHLDPEGTLLPKSDWIRVVGTLPVGSLNSMVNSMNRLLMEEAHKGIIDLDAEWNPFVDAHVPLISVEDYLSSPSSSSSSSSTPAPSLIDAAHVILSPFGRPSGWRLKLANRSLVYAILARGEQQPLRVGWKVVTMEEYHFSKEREQQEDPAFTHNGGLIVDDTMVRIENCPFDMDANYVRYMVSRYQLAPEGNTVLEWRGTTNDGKVAPLMFIVRFASASWARAAIRECQATVVNGKTIKLVQYPQQIRYKES